MLRRPLLLPSGPLQFLSSPRRREYLKPNCDRPQTSPPVTSDLAIDNPRVERRRPTREYFGREPEATARETMSRESPNRAAIARTDIPSLPHRHAVVANDF